MNSVRTCEKCHTSGTVEQMIGCDMCDIWLHMKCAGVTTDTADPDKSWRCERCLHDEATERTSHRSRKTGRTTSSISAQRAELALQLLEEEQALIKRNREREDEFLKKEAEMQKKRAEEDAKLLKQKHDLLKSLEDGNGSIRSGISSNASRRRVQEWLGSNSGGLVPVTEQPQMSGPTAELSATSKISALPIMPPRKSGVDVLLSQDAEGSTIAPKSTSTPQKTLSTPLILSNTPVPPMVVPSEITTSASNAKWGGYYPGINVFSSSVLPTIPENKPSVTNVDTTNAPLGSYATSQAIPLSVGNPANQYPHIYATGSKFTYASGYESTSTGQTVSVNPSSSPFVSVPAQSFGLTPSVVTTSSLLKSGVPCPGQWNELQTFPVVPARSTGLYAQAQFGQRMDGSSNPVVTAANVSNSDVHQVSRSRYPVPSGVQQQNEPVQSAS
ncbi:uncharacterized protein LOC134287389 [Aedes albopictus]|uniref:PHD-type domain-containing protein n=1 Tax=Aedes albopictus TaxID=7160 RepID=A0ABM1Z0V3_AEDAL